MKLKTYIGVLSLLVLSACDNGEPLVSEKGDSFARFLNFEYVGEDDLFDLVQTEKQYLNPILSGFYPDPSVTRAGDYFYLVNSTFTYYPGIPIFRSKDLVDWEQIGHVLDRPDMVDMSGLETSRGIFAPTIEFHGGRFYVSTTCIDCGGNFIVTATNPAGPWSDPVWIPEVGGIDPSIFFDDDRRLFMANNDGPLGEPRYEGHRAIWFRELDPKTFQPIASQIVLVDGGAFPDDNPIWIEGPHIYKINNYYYLSAAEGGTEFSHSQVIFRSRNIEGPYKSFEGNPILTQRTLPKNRPGPVNATGHADIIQDGAGEWWAVFLGTRPYKDNFYNTGRETFLLPVQWKNGWPRVTERDDVVEAIGTRPAPLSGQPFTDSYNGNFKVRTDFTAALGFEWIALRNQNENIRIGDGNLFIKHVDKSTLSQSPNCVYRRQQHAKSSVKTHLDVSQLAVGEAAGMIIQQNEQHSYFLGVTRGKDETDQLVLRTNTGPDQSNTFYASFPKNDADSSIELSIEAEEDIYHFFAKLGSGELMKAFESHDATKLSTAFAGGFVGAMYGLCVVTL